MKYAIRFLFICLVIGSFAQNAFAQLRVLDVKRYGAKGDSRTVTDGAMSSSSATLTSATAAFTAGDVGKTVIVRGAVATTTPLVTTVSGFTNSTTVTLATVATLTVSSARVDIGTLDIAAFRAALAACPTQGCIIDVPAGNYMAGSITTASQFRINRNNVILRGWGINTTKYIYSSQGADHDSTFPSGNGISVGQAGTRNAREHVVISGFEMEDVNNGSPLAVGGNPSCIDIWYTSDIKIKDMKFTNCKGNGAVNAQGSVSGGVATEKGIWIENSIFTSNDTNDANYIEGDGINIGNYIDIHVTGNQIYAVGRHGFEGGGKSTDAYITNNTIDMQSRGFSGINPTNYNRCVIANNSVINIASGGVGYPIDFTTDVGSGFTLDELIVSNNVVTTAGPYGMRFQDSSGSPSSGVDHITVIGNRVTSAGYGVLLGAADFPNLLITGNTFNISAYLLSQAGSPGGSTPVAGRQVSITGNNLPTGAVIDFTSTFSNWSGSNLVKVWDNQVGSAVTGQTTQGAYGIQGATSDGSLILTQGATTGSVIVGGKTTTTALFSGYPNSVGMVPLELNTGQSTSNNNKTAYLALVSNQSGTTNALGTIAFGNSSLGTTEKQLAMVYGSTDGATNLGRLQFFTVNAGTVTEGGRFDSSARFAVGRTSSIAGQLDVLSGSTTRSAAIFQAASGASSSQNNISSKNGSGTQTFGVTAGGDVTGLTFNGLTITTSTGTVTVANSKTLTVSNTLTFTGTDGTSFAFPSGSGTVITADSTVTKTNLTLDGEGTGNVVKLPFKLWLPMAGCNNATAGPMWDLPTSNAPTAACVTGTNIQKGVLQFADSANQTAQVTLFLPADWDSSKNVDINVFFTTSDTTNGNTVKLTVATACRTPGITGATFSDDPSFNTAQTMTFTLGGSANANALSYTSQSAVTMTGCSAGDMLHVKVGRDVTDTVTSTINLVGAELTWRRSM